MGGRSDVAARAAPYVPAVMGLAARCVLLVKGKLGAVLDAAEDPREVLEYAHQEEQRRLVEVRRALVEVAASKAQLDRAVKRTHERIPIFEQQAQRALELGRNELAREALARKHAAMAEQDDLERHAAEIGDEERRLAAAERQLAARIDEFRSHKTILSARYSSAEARVHAAEAITLVSSELAELNLALGRAEEKTERLRARADALDTLIETGAVPQSWGGVDALGLELRRLASAEAVETELAELTRRVGQRPPAELGDGS